MADVKGLVNDPEFHKLDLATQRQALSRLDPDLGKLSDNELGAFQLRLKGQGPQIGPPDPYAGDQPMSFRGIGRALTHQTPQGLAMFGGIAGSAIGMPIGGAAIGATAGEALKNFAPSTFGEPADTGVERLGEIGKQTLLQGVVPKIAGNILQYGIKGAAATIPFIKSLPAVKIAELINKAKGYMMPESSLIETAAQNFRTNPAEIPGFENISQTSISKLGGVPYKQTGISPIKLRPIARDMLSDVSTVRNAKLATGDPTIVRQIAANDLVTRNYSKAADTINPSAILDEIGKRPDVYEEAFGKPALDTFTDLMKTAQDRGVGKITDLASWREGRKAFYISLPFHALGEYRLGAVASALVLGTDAMKAIASNPRLGQMILQATKTNATAPEAGLLSKAIVYGLRGISLYLQTPEGKKEKVQVGENGELQTPR